MDAWSDEQNDATVANYFAMLSHDARGLPHSKALHNRLLQSVISRPRGAIEYKHQNISAVLKSLGEDWIPGYKPAFNFQTSLIDAVQRWLSQNPAWLTRTRVDNELSEPLWARDGTNLWIGPRPRSAMRLSRRNWSRRLPLLENMTLQSATRAIGSSVAPEKSGSSTMSANA